jgi:uncharacterized protein YukE
MPKYQADVRFTVYDIEAKDMAEASEKINNLIDQLGSVETELGWEDVFWSDILSEQE